MLQNRVFTTALIISLAIFSGCGYKETNRQIRDIGYLKFNKSLFETYTVVVNDTYKFKLDSCSSKDELDRCKADTMNKRYEISSGNSNIKVYDKENNLIKEKNIFIGDLVTVEVNLKWKD